MPPGTIGVSKSAPPEPVLVTVKVRAAELVRRDLVVAGAAGQVGDLAGDAGEVEVARVADDRDEQALLGVDGDADVLLRRGR